MARTTPVIGIVNPRSAGGLTQSQFVRLRTLAGASIPGGSGSISWKVTSAPGDAQRLTRVALEQGADTILSVGGDGTHNEVVRGFFGDRGESVNPCARLGVIHRGTGGDFRKSLGIGPSIGEALAAVAQWRMERVDIGAIDYHGETGEVTHSYFVNIASAGISGVVDRFAHRSRIKALGGTVAFAWATVRAFMSYRNCRVNIRIDNNAAREHLICAVAACNGAYFGGGMKISPRSLLDDGLLDVVCLGDFALRDFLLRGKRLYTGTHLDLAQVWHCRATSLVLSPVSQERILLDIDGESPGMLPATIRILPRALNVIVGDNPLVAGER